MRDLHVDINTAPCPQSGLLVSALKPDDETAAYALARWARPDLSNERWENFLCDWHADPDGRGILVARNQRGGILGFVCWWRLPDLEHGETLWAGPFFVREMGVRPLVRDALEHALYQLSCTTEATLRIAPDATPLRPPYSTLV